jgi:serine/threonine protein kinase
MPWQNQEKKAVGGQVCVVPHEQIVMRRVPPARARNPYRCSSVSLGDMAMTSARACPDIRDWQRLLAGLVSEEEAGPLERHLEGCVACQRLVRDLPDADSLAAALHGCAAGPGFDAEVVAAADRLLERVRGGQAPPGETVDTRGRVRPGFLGPPQGPDELGRLGPYRVLQELSQGGMGVVYKAHHLALDRLVALKMIRDPAYAGGQAWRRFQDEARTVARLNHPNVVQIYDVGEHDGLPYFAMEYCPGGSLDAKLGRTPLSAVEAAGLTEVLARAVHAAHSKGVLHRDLKPANVLLAEDGTPKVTDFGLAKRLNEPGSTATGVILGTPSYMAPEQAAGRKDLGPAVDVWALGAILYELLTGRPPFKAATVPETIVQVLQDEPAAPSRLNRGVPATLEAICLKCLAKDPARRYPSALALAGALQRFRKGQPISNGHGTGWPWRFLGAVAGLLVAALVLVGLWLALRPPANGPPFKGDITVLLTSEQDGKFNLPLRDPEALPARDGYQFRVEAQVAPAAYLHPGHRRGGQGHPAVPLAAGPLG